MKRGLVIEGGGFRCAYAAGALYHLLKERPDLRFDVVAANSASVLTAAFFVTRQLKEMEDFWLRSPALASPKLLNFWRVPISWHKPLIDIDYLFELFQTEFQIDLKALQQSPTDFFVTVMHYATGRPERFSNRDPEIYDAMRASCAIPWAYNRDIFIRGERYIDGFYDSIPLRIAKEQQCDDIWIISTRPHGYRKGRLKLFEKLPMIRHCRLLAKRHLYYNATAEEIEGNPDYRILRPKEKLAAARFTNNLQALRGVFRQGAEDMRQSLKFKPSLA